MLLNVVKSSVRIQERRHTQWIDMLHLSDIYALTLRNQRLRARLCVHMSVESSWSVCMERKKETKRENLIYHIIYTYTQTPIIISNTWNRCIRANKRQSIHASVNVSIEKCCENVFDIWAGKYAQDLTSFIWWNTSESVTHY